MSFFTYALRRTVGALGSLLVAIWLIQFAVSHLDAPRDETLRPIPSAILESIYPIGRFQPDLGNEWNTAAGVVAVALVALLALGLAWRLRGQHSL
jgi:hypothetical protein